MAPSGRIAASFARLKAQGRTGLIAYLTVGYPSLAETPALAAALLQGGASLLELGVPFSDPLADGATIQRASVAALRQGVGMAQCLEVAQGLRKAWPGVPLILMGYYNTFLSYGLEPFCADGARAGLDGVIAVDLPPEEAGAFLEHSQPAGLDLVFLLAPTSTEERIRTVAAHAQGFIYCVSVTGVTGARARLPPQLPRFLARVRAHTSLPLAVGFGIARREHVTAVGRHADAAVVGSALLDVIDQSPPEGRVPALRGFIAELLGEGAPGRRRAHET